MQTIVGIVKSNFCGEFIEEYESTLCGELLWEFVRLTNVFAFESSILNLKYANVYSNLKPIGMGRPYLINLIQKNGTYKERNHFVYILKLCSDYSMSSVHDEGASCAACFILECYVIEKMKGTSTEKHYRISEEINECLLPIYRMAKNSKDWIKQFWAERIKEYLNRRIPMIKQKALVGGKYLKELLGGLRWLKYL